MNADAHNPRGTVVAISAAVAVVAAGVSVGRLLLTNGAALTNLVWAEDGLFPLCVKAGNPVSCALEPYAGYLLLLPRIVAWPVSLVPIGSWALASNLAAALVAGLLAAAVVYVLRSSGSGWVCTIVVALLPVVAPVMALEAVNSTASSYMLLPYVGCLALCLPSTGRLPVVGYTVGALLIALTIPSAAILLVPLAVQVWRRRIGRRDGAVIGAALVVGLGAQIVAVLVADSSRAVGVSWSALLKFADALPSAWLTNWPLADWRVEGGAFEAAGWPVPALLVVAAVVSLAVVLVVRPGYVANAVGLLVLCGLCFAAAPVVLLDSANNRYYILLLLLWVAAGVVALDRWTPRRWHVVAMAGVVAVLAVLWLPRLPATDFRAVAIPTWPTEITRARLGCLENPGGTASLSFSPSWPTTALTGRTTNVVHCSVVTGR